MLTIHIIRNNRFRQMIKLTIVQAEIVVTFFIVGFHSRDTYAIKTYLFLIEFFKYKMKHEWGT